MINIAKKLMLVAVAAPLIPKGGIRIAFRIMFNTAPKKIIRLFFFTLPMPSVIEKLRRENPLNIKPIASICKAIVAATYFAPNKTMIIS